MDNIIKKNKRAITITIIALLNILFLLKINYQCPWKKNLNIYCAGCGGTRMLKSLLSQNYEQAFRYNPLLFILLVLLIIYITYIIICLILKKKYYQFNTKHLIILSIITITFMLLRNIEIFSYLKPTNIP